MARGNIVACKTEAKNNYACSTERESLFIRAVKINDRSKSFADGAVVTCKFLGSFLFPGRRLFLRKITKPLLILDYYCKYALFCLYPLSLMNSVEEMKINQFLQLRNYLDKYQNIENFHLNIYLVFVEIN